MKTDELEQLKIALAALEAAFDAEDLSYDQAGVMHAHRKLRQLVASAKVRAPKNGELT